VEVTVRQDRLCEGEADISRPKDPEAEAEGAVRPGCSYRDFGAVRPAEGPA
jgi:hypothetical protein